MTDRLGILVRRLRTRAGLTQEQMAERSGVSVRTIRRLETGKAADHRLGTVNLLADALDLGAEERRQLTAVLSPAPDPDPIPAPDPAPALDDSTPAPALDSIPAPDANPEPALPQGHHAAKSSYAEAGGVLADAAAELAREVGRRWQKEEEQRRVHDPFPLPVRWNRAPARLTDHAENIQRLPPGARPLPMDLAGDLRSVADVYRRIPSGRLVMLGRAGSGKSIMAIRLVLDLLGNPAHPGRVPVIFSVGAWDATAVALRDWLVDLLLRDYPHLARRTPGGSTLAAALIDAGFILPVLDGFDEIAEGLRQEALEALNATSLPLVLTSRAAEYAEAVRAARAPLVWAAGIELTGLTPDDLLVYLSRTTRPAGVEDGDGSGADLWGPVLDVLRAGESEACEQLSEVLSTPLMIALARTMYSEAPGRDPAELLDGSRFPTASSLEDHLLAGFVPTVYRPRVAERSGAAARSRDRPRNWEPERARHWLGHLAHHLVRLDRDRQDLAWWQIGESLPRSTRVLAVVLVSALCITVSDWAVVLIVTGIPLGEVLVQGAVVGPVGGLAFGSVYAAVAAFGGGSFAPSQVRLRLHGRAGGIGRRTVRTFADRFAAVMPGGFVMGIGCACAFALQRALYEGRSLTDPALMDTVLINMLVFGLIFSSAAGLVFGLLAALETPLDVASAATPAGLLSANRATVHRQLLVIVPVLTLAIAVGGTLIVRLLRGLLGPMSWSLPEGLVIGAVGGFGGGLSYTLCFTAWGQWLIFSRLLLPLTGKLPWRTDAFLDDAYRRGVLRRSGAVYQFRHVRLQHHLGHTYRQRRGNYAPATYSGPAASR
ncbi:helix-turn-helix domain-containing protein [Streptomyces sp. PTY087I2]|uniref:helix-turn-helix domain-containing protein n=1 Tax=Streptomyces sp. PTY087I2 TaxID=1819298 RepID=UPI00080BB8AF|nr:helix-turn-helix domain-containing protein [Streptomyces sp. PTY087I2]OCC08055.1 Helix-turn-helix domain protein [Streptomyces sp. PTY087I2]